MFLAMNFFFWPTPSKIGQFEQKWPINWPSGIPGKYPIGILTCYGSIWIAINVDFDLKKQFST
jgi:hypothetical protein